MRYVALLRGVNVGGKNKVPMKDLASLFEGAGCTRVITYIQSGNVVFTATEKTVRNLAAEISRRIAARFGHRVPVVIRTARQLEAIAGANPFLQTNADVKNLHVCFLAGEPSPECIATLDPPRSLPDAFQVCGGEIYLHLPNGAGHSKLTNAWFDSRLKTISTVRNWATTLSLLELCNRL